VTASGEPLRIGLVGQGQDLLKATEALKAMPWLRIVVVASHRSEDAMLARNLNLALVTRAWDFFRYGPDLVLELNDDPREYERLRSLKSQGVELLGPQGAWLLIDLLRRGETDTPVPVEVVREIEVVREVVTEVPIVVVRDVVEEVPAPVGTDAGREAPPQLLVIDDNPLAGGTLVQLLESAGYRVALAASGLEGIRWVRERGTPFDLAVVDLGLPDVPGWEAVKAVKQADAGTPVIVVSGFDEARASRRARELGVDSVMLKPIHQRDLLHTVQALLAPRSGGPDGRAC
jgi:CheY-like chemotaxis protein